MRPPKPRVAGLPKVVSTVGDQITTIRTGCSNLLVAIFSVLVHDSFFAN
jgi:hypothetical protein